MLTGLIERYVRREVAPYAAQAVVSKRRSRRRARIADIRPHMVLLESRLLFSQTFYEVTGGAALTDNTSGTVNIGSHAGTLADPYPAPTLRAAIVVANANGGGTIEFDPSLFTSGSANINLSVAASGTNGANPDGTDNTAGPSDFGSYTNVTIIGPSGANGLTLANSGTPLSGSTNFGTPDQTNYASAYATAAWDIRHSMTTSFNYELPIGKGKRFGGGMNRVMSRIPVMMKTCSSSDSAMKMITHFRVRSSGSR